MRLKLIEGKPPEGEWGHCLHGYGSYGETKDGTAFILSSALSGIALAGGTYVGEPFVRPLPPGTVITITVRESAPHSVQVVKPTPAVEWVRWDQVPFGGTVVDRQSGVWLKLPDSSGACVKSGCVFSYKIMLQDSYRRPFDPWWLEPVVEEPKP